MTGIAAVMDAIAARAGDADQGRAGLDADIRLLFASGVLARLATTASGPRVQEAVTLFRSLGRASLSVGRLAEGHVNALRLIDLYGNEDQIARFRMAAEDGELSGVWGAEGAVAVSIDRTDGQIVRLAGGKRFCSGLGLVRHAVVTARGEEGVQLVIVDAGDQRRQDASGWKTTGMRATESGSYDLNGIRGELLGKPGDYLREPWFEGGIWRYAALHCGALEALAGAVRDRVAMLDDPGPMRAARLVELTRLAQTARLWVEHAAGAVEAADTPDIVAALLAREAVEEACLRGIAIADRALGTRAFMEGTGVERIRRDLAFFLRQANLDGKTQLAARLILNRARDGGST